MKTLLKNMKNRLYSYSLSNFLNIRHNRFKFVGTNSKYLVLVGKSDGWVQGQIGFLPSCILKVSPLHLTLDRIHQDSGLMVYKHLAYFMIYLGPDKTTDGSIYDIRFQWLTSFRAILHRIGFLWVINCRKPHFTR